MHVVFTGFFKLVYKLDQTFIKSLSQSLRPMLDNPKPSNQSDHLKSAGERIDANFSMNAWKQKIYHN